MNMMLQVAAVQNFTEKKCRFMPEQAVYVNTHCGPQQILTVLMQPRENFLEETCSWHPETLLNPQIVQIWASRVKDIPQ